MATEFHHVPKVMAVYLKLSEYPILARQIRGRMRDELLNETLFFGLEHARHAIAEWTEDYNTGRPHSALDYQTPAAFAAKLTAREGIYSCRSSNPRWGYFSGRSVAAA